MNNNRYSEHAVDLIALQDSEHSVSRRNRRMPDNQINITIIVNGQTATVTGNIHAPLRTVISEALRETGNQGQPPENWELRDAAGQLLDLGKKIEEFGFDPTTKLFLSLKAGVGGN
jgi:hypothetical protein